MYLECSPDYVGRRKDVFAVKRVDARSSLKKRTYLMNNKLIQIQCMLISGIKFKSDNLFIENGRKIPDQMGASVMLSNDNFQVNFK